MAEQTPNAFAPVIKNAIWDVNTQTWVPMELPTAGGGIVVTTSTPLPVAGPLTDAQLRASMVPVQGTFWQTTQPVSAASLPLPTGAATETGHLAAIDTKIPALGQAVAANSVPVILPSATITTLTPPAAITGFALETTQLAQATLIGAVAETAPSTDTASSGLNGRLQRIAQRITSLIALLPAALGQGTMAQSLRVVLASDQAAIPVTASAGSNLNTSSLALEATQTANGVLLGAVTEAAPATDTASSGLNGRLQRIAQRITSLIALLPSALGSGGGLKIDGSGTVLPVSLASVPALVAGSALIGKVGIDQTTPGTTNAVQANAGTNLNTSALAIETGGNLATLAGKDFAVSAKQDTGNTSLSAISASLGTASINAPETASVLDSLQRLNTKLNTLTRQAMPPRLPAKLKPNTTLLLIGVR